MNIYILEAFLSAHSGCTKNKDGRGTEVNDGSSRSTCFNFYRHRYNAASILLLKVKEFL